MIRNPAGFFFFRLFFDDVYAIGRQVNGCTGKMGQSVIKAADFAGLNIVPFSFGSEEESGSTVEVCGNSITVHGPLEREKTLSSLYVEYPNLIVVDYTVPSAVNGTTFMVATEMC